MILFFFICLAFLTWLICRELERSGSQGAIPLGNCAGCGQALDDEWLICPRCGTLVQEHCPACGGKHACGDAFCPWCGVAAEERAA